MSNIVFASIVLFLTTGLVTGLVLIPETPEEQVMSVFFEVLFIPLLLIMYWGAFQEHPWPGFLIPWAAGLAGLALGVFLTKRKR